MLDKYHVFNGPNQLLETKQSLQSQLWYWLLRAADDGDKLSLPVTEWKGLNSVGGSANLEGYLESGDGALMFTTSDGLKYRVSWFGLADTQDPTHGFNFLTGGQLTKSDGTPLDNVNAAKKYVLGKPRVADFGIPVSVSAYAGLGGGVTVKVDRFGRVYLTVSGGVGIGGKGASCGFGGYTTDYQMDKDELGNTMNGVSLSANGGFVNVVGVSAPVEGPLALEGGGGFVFGGSLSVDVTFEIFRFQ